MGTVQSAPEEEVLFLCQASPDHLKMIRSTARKLRLCAAAGTPLAAFAELTLRRSETSSGTNLQGREGAAWQDNLMKSFDDARGPRLVENLPSSPAPVEQQLQHRSAALADCNKTLALA